jgi:hypothetical protein
MAGKSDFEAPVRRRLARLAPTKATCRKIGRAKTRSASHDRLR